MSPFELRWQNTACFSGSIDKARVGQKGDAYFVNYPPGSNNRRMLQFHIERGNSREPRYCMRPQKVTIQALNEYGEEIIVDGEDEMAKCFCHELEHLDGMIFLDKAIEELSVV